MTWVGIGLTVFGILILLSVVSVTVLYFVGWLLAWNDGA